MEEQGVRNRISQLEAGIGQMNKVLDENLQGAETPSSLDAGAGSVGAVGEGSESKEHIDQLARMDSVEVNGVVNDDDEWEDEVLEKDYIDASVVCKDALKVKKNKVSKVDYPEDKSDDMTESFNTSSVDSTQDESQHMERLRKSRAEQDSVRKISSGNNHRFRVVSVGNSTSTNTSTNTITSTSASSSRKSSYNMKNDTNGSQPPVSPNINSHAEEAYTDKLQKRKDYLTMKCIKLQREIDYLNKMIDQGNLSMDDSKKLNKAVDKLTEYLDKKKKEQYEVGLLLSRQFRKEVDRGEKSEFWISRN